MHNEFCLTKGKVFLPPWLTVLPQQKFARKPPVLKRMKTISSYASFSSRKQWRKMQGVQKVPLTGILRKLGGTQ